MRREKDWWYGVVQSVLMENLLGDLIGHFLRKSR